MPNLHRDTLGRVVFYGVAVVGDSLGSKMVPTVKIRPLRLAPRGKIEAGLAARAASVAVGLGEAFRPRGSAVRDCFKGQNAVLPPAVGAHKFSGTQVESVQ